MTAIKAVVSPILVTLLIVIEILACGENQALAAALILATLLIYGSVLAIKLNLVVGLWSGLITFGLVNFIVGHDCCLFCVFYLSIFFIFWKAVKKFFPNRFKRPARI
jgi:hypothetical protein